MATRLNSTETSIGKDDAEPSGQKAAEFVVVDKKTGKGYLTFYDIDECTANAIMAGAAIILRNCMQGPGNHT